MSLNAAFFESLADISNQALVGVATELAKSRRLVDMMGPADFLSARQTKEPGQEIKPIWNSSESSASQSASLEVQVAEAFATACEEETPESLALMTKVTRSGVDRGALLRLLGQVTSSASPQKKVSP